MILKEENNQEKILTDGVLDVNHEPENMPSAIGKRSSDGCLSHEEDLAKVIELQEVIDKQSQEQSQMKERLAALSAHVTELEKDLDTARRDLLKSEEVNIKLQQDVCEVGERDGSIEERLCQKEAQLDERTRSCSGRPDLGSALDLRFPMAEWPADSSGNGAVLWCPQKGRLAVLHKEPSKVQTLKEQDWELVQQASMLANVAQVFKSDEGVSDGEGNRVTFFSSATQLSPSRQANAKTLTVMLQECWGFSPRDLEATNLKEGHSDSLLQGLTSLFLQSSLFIKVGTKILEYTASRARTGLTPNG